MQPNEVEHLLAILDLNRQGQGCRAIARAMNDQGVPSKKGKHWDHSAISSIIERHEREPGLASKLGPEAQKAENFRPHKTTKEKRNGTRQRN